jgi:hypothetical protein
MRQLGGYAQSLSRDDSLYDDRGSKPHDTALGDSVCLMRPRLLVVRDRNGWGQEACVRGS